MTEPIVSLTHIRTLAHAACDAGHNVYVANPYPAGSAAHDHFINDFEQRRLVLAIQVHGSSRFALVD